MSKKDFIIVETQRRFGKTAAMLLENADADQVLRFIEVAIISARRCLPRSKADLVVLFLGVALRIAAGSYKEALLQEFRARKYLEAAHEAEISTLDSEERGGAV